VWLYVIGGQGIIVASNYAEARPTPEHAAAIDKRPQMKSTIEHYRGSAARVADDLMLDPDGVDRLLASRGVPPDYFVSNDDNAYLEYSTPKGNALDAKQSAIINYSMLARFKTIDSGAK
jgi:spermidine synthase